MKASITSGQTLLALTGFAWIIMFYSQFWLPPDILSEQAKRFETPITPAGYAFAGIRFVISVLQGAGAFLPWACKREPWPAECLSATEWPWICGWTLEALWTLTQFLLQRYRPGTEPWELLLLGAGFRLGEHVAMGLAMRKALVAVQRLQVQGTGTTSVNFAIVFYLLSSGLSCGWLALAACRGALDLAVSCGASYDDLLPWSLALLLVATFTSFLQPWVWGIEPCPPLPDKAGVDPGLPPTGSLVHSGGYTAPALSLQIVSGSGGEADAEAGAGAGQAMDTASSGGCKSPLMKSSSASSAARPRSNIMARAAGAASAALVGVSAYSAALVWGFAGIAVAAGTGRTPWPTVVFVALAAEAVGGLGPLFWLWWHVERRLEA